MTAQRKSYGLCSKLFLYYEYKDQNIKTQMQNQIFHVQNYLITRCSTSRALLLLSFVHATEDCPRDLEASAFT